MNEKILIPKKCKVGFQKRGDTYTGLLGYIILNDGKKWRKEDSWTKWCTQYKDSETMQADKEKAFYNSREAALRQKKEIEGFVKNKSHYYYNDAYYQNAAKQTDDEYLKARNLFDIKNYQPYLGNYSSDEKIKPIEFENVPIEGFVLNKKVGGNNGSWNPRQTYSRVYDPRGWEFEITVPNLLYILENANSIKGKGLEGKFIYGWSGKDLLLIPEQAPEYQSMLAYTKLQDMKISKKDLVPGNVYLCSDNEERMFMGEATEYKSTGYKSGTYYDNGKKLWFFNENWEGFHTRGINTVKKLVRTNDPNYADLMDKLEKKPEYKPKKLFYEEIKTEKELISVLSKTVNDYGYVSLFEKTNSKFKPKEIYVKFNQQYSKNKLEQLNDAELKLLFTSSTYSFSNYNKPERLSELLKEKLWQQKTTE